MAKDYKSMNVFEKLLEVQKHVNYLKKENTNTGQKYNYVSGTQAVAAVRGVMDEVGLILKSEIIGQDVIERQYQKIDNYNGKETVKNMVDYFTRAHMKFTWVNVDNPAERDENLWESQGIDIGGEKGIGKAATYGEKYFILKYFHIATDNMDPDTFDKYYGYESPEEEPAPKVRKITNDQKKELAGYLETKQLTKVDARKHMKEIAGVESILELTFEQAEELKKRFEKLPDKE